MRQGGIGRESFGGRGRLVVFADPNARSPPPWPVTHSFRCRARVPHLLHATTVSSFNPPDQNQPPTAIATPVYRSISTRRAISTMCICMPRIPGCSVFFFINYGKRIRTLNFFFFFCSKVLILNFCIRF